MRPSRCMTLRSLRTPRCGPLPVRGEWLRPSRVQLQRLQPVGRGGSRCSPCGGWQSTVSHSSRRPSSTEMKKRSSEFCSTEPARTADRGSKTAGTMRMHLPCPLPCWIRHPLEVRWDASGCRVGSRGCGAMAETTDHVHRQAGRRLLLRAGTSRVSMWHLPSVLRHQQSCSRQRTARHVARIDETTRMVRLCCVQPLSAACL